MKQRRWTRCALVYWGTNDCIVSVAALFIGVFATEAGDRAILMAGLAATIV